MKYCYCKSSQLSTNISVHHTKLSASLILSRMSSIHILTLKKALLTERLVLSFKIPHQHAISKYTNGISVQHFPIKSTCSSFTYCQISYNSDETIEIYFAVSCILFAYWGMLVRQYRMMTLIQFRKATVRGRLCRGKIT